MEKGWVSSFTLYLDKVALRIEDEGMVAVHACEIAGDDEALVDLLGVAKDLVGEGEEGLVGSVLQVDVLEDVCPDAATIVLVALSEHGHIAQCLVESAFVEEVVEAAYHIVECDLSEQILVLAQPSGQDAGVREEKGSVAKLVRLGQLEEVKILFEQVVDSIMVLFIMAALDEEG